jgi:trans-2,3-dihydro-3-hydroxyanthranilate isomerase
MSLGATVEPAAIAAALGLSVTDIDGVSPVQVVGAGTQAILAPLRNLDALRRCRLDLKGFAPLAARGFPPLVYLFCRETGDDGHDLRVRFFFEAHGVREDAATGNGAAFLGAYLHAHGLLPTERDTLRIAQGEEVRRPSSVLLRVAPATGAVHVGGHVVPIIEGHLL